MFRSKFQARCLRRGVRWHSIAKKYGSKLNDMAKARGISVDELISEAREVSKAKSDPLGLRSELAAVRNSNKSQREKLQPSTELKQIARDEAPTKDLGSYVDVDKLRLHDPREIEMIWKARFLNSSNEFCGAIEAGAFSRLYVNARRWPTFVLPLPRGEDGVELHYVQWSFVTSHTIHCLITSLAEYKLHGEYAHPHTTVMFHTDLVGDKGIVLTNTALMSNEMPMDQAVLLTLNLQRFYTASSSSPHGQQKLDLLKKFNEGDASFSVDDLIEAAETLD